MQDGATPAVLASKAGHREIADLIAAGGSAAARHQLPTQAPPRVREDYTLHMHDRVQVQREAFTQLATIYVYTEGADRSVTSEAKQ